MKKVFSALKDNGYVIIEDAVPPELINMGHKALNSLFSMPYEEKALYKHDKPTEPGFTPYGEAKALDTGIPNLLEAWDISSTVPVKWPKEMIQEWETLVKFESYIYQTGLKLLTQLEDELNLSEGTFTNLIHRYSGGIHFLHYPANLVSNGTGARRQSLHADMTLITLNPPATRDGLIISHEGVSKIVEPKDGEVLVLPGLVMEFLTQGRIKGCLHTVDTPISIESSFSRISSPFFCCPDTDSILTIPQEFRDTQYQNTPITMGEFRSSYFKKIFGSQFQQPCP